MADADTRNKRGSCIGLDLSWFRIYPDPNRAIDVYDRQQTAYKYSGISSSIVTGGISPYRTLMGVGM